MYANYDTVLFDIDGTLIHTDPQYFHLVPGKVLDLLDVPHDILDLMDFWFDGLNRTEKFFQKLGVDHALFWPEYHRLDSAELRKQYMMPYDDVDELVKLKKSGYRIGAVTGAPPDIAEAGVSVLESQLGKVFGAVVSAHRSNGIEAKPSPEGLLKCMEKLGSEPRRTIYVGNAEEDVLAANAAKVMDVIVNRGEYLYPAARPSITIMHLRHLRTLVGL